MEVPMQLPMNRRWFLARASASIAALAATFNGWTVSAKQPGLPVYRLDAFRDPTTRDGQHCGGRRACAACIGHAAHRLFVSLEAADTYRPHPGCDCQPIAGGTLPYGTWVALFGSPRNTQRQYVDTRCDWVADIID
jgi:hypothetical protein